MDLAITRRALTYEAGLEPRPPETIDLAVIHCTELPDLETARSYGERVCYPNSGTGNSGHYYLDRDGAIEEWVAPERVAHHVRGFNDHSIGIELVNRGRWPDWLHSGRQEMTEAYPDAQVEALVHLLLWLCGRFPGLRWIAGHEDLDTRRVPASDRAGSMVFRKRDPGPRFPWPRVLDAIPMNRFRG